jgi:hypothetical protein
MNTAALKVGRLLEVRAEAGYRTRDDVDAIFEQIGRAMSKLPEGAQHIVVADWRRCPIMSPEAAEYMATSIARSNPGLLRSAALTQYSASTGVLQFLRVIREANHPNRQLFRSSDELIRWLDEVTTLAESRRLRDFLAYR